MPIRQIFPGDAPQSNSKESSQDFLRGCVLIQYIVNGFELGSSYRLLQDFGIQSQFIAEVIIYGCDICSRSGTNFANCGSLIAPVGKDRSGNSQQLLARWVRGRGVLFALRHFQPVL